ncbi:S24 family peptidase [Oceanidesulfovibrio marinus]|uniref:S24 family peptidase n=1 Tax=Oceanidesulfovibrio marinus TaxID=370038 RepID=UPI00142F181D|nr:S24 family peptidase [Oceanidesulfovibrio marinus]
MNKKTNNVSELPTIGRVFGAGLDRHLKHAGRGAARSLALKMDKHDSYISDLRKGKSGGTEETRLRIAALLGFPYEYFLNLGFKELNIPEHLHREYVSPRKQDIAKHRLVLDNEEDTLSWIPLVEPSDTGPRATGKNLKLYATKEWFEEHGTTSADCVCIIQAGDAMSPQIQDGDLLFLARNDKKLRETQVYALSSEDRIVVRRFFAGSRDDIFECDNRDRKHLDVHLSPAAKMMCENAPRSWKIYGRVFFVGRYL